MKIKTIVSTMNLKDWKELVERTNLQTDCIIVNQTNCDKIENYKFKDLNIKIVSINQKGLSKSRNLGLDLIDNSFDFVYFADDDIIMSNDFYSNIVDKNVDVYVFGCNIDGEIKLPKKNINYLTSMQLSSIQIVYSVNFFKKYNIKFDERFGSGTKFGSGEENIMLFDMLKHKAKFYSSRCVIAKTNNLRPSTWFKGFNKEFLFNRGAIFTRMTKTYSILLILQFAIRKYRVYSKENIGFFQALSEMFKGRKYFLGLDNE